MDNNVGSSTVENFDVQPLKKAKCTEFDLLESDKMKNVLQMPSTASPTRETLSSVCEFKDEQISKEKHSGEVIIVDPMPSVALPTIETSNNVGDTYDYLPQGIFFVYICSLVCNLLIIVLRYKANPY
jgi:hypothetical protein